MWNTPSQEILEKIPKLYETENIPVENKTIYLHFFIGDCHWYIAEFDGEDIFFGYAILNGDIQNAEWGYISFSELKEIKIDDWYEVECKEMFIPFSVCNGLAIVQNYHIKWG